MLLEYLTIHWHITCTGNVASRMETLSGNERTENWYLSCRHYHYILRSGFIIITIQREKSNLSLSAHSARLSTKKTRWFMLTVAAQMDLLNESPYCNAKNNMVSLCLCFTR